MKNHLLLVIVIFLSLSPAWARKPAVEDFVGIEPKGTDFSKPAKESAFTPYNFTQNNPSFAANSPTNTYAIWVLFAMVATLPLMSWLVLSRGKKVEDEIDNVHHLKDYRASKEDDHDDISKAS